MDACVERNHVSSSVDCNGGKIERQLFIPFLEKLLDTDEIEGLQWMSTEKRVFRMPWKHMKRHDYDLERDSMLFKAWAINSGKFKETEQDPSRWKINFRSALNTMKHVLVEEESSDEDCRVFRIVEPPASQQRKRRSSDMLGTDAYSVSGYGTAPPAKSCPAKTEQDRSSAPTAAIPAANHQYPWQPPHYVYPQAGVPMATAPPPQQVTYFTAVDGTQHATAGATTTTYYVQNPHTQAMVPSPYQHQQLQHHHHHHQAVNGTVMAGGQYASPAQGTVAGTHVTQYPGYVSTGPAQQYGSAVPTSAAAGSAAQTASGVFLRPAAHQLTVHTATGHPIMPVRNEQMVHMLSPQSLKTNNSCESLASIQSTTVAPSVTAAMATSSACSLEQQYQPHTQTELSHMQVVMTTEKNNTAPSASKPKHAGKLSRKTTQKFFGDSRPSANGSGKAASRKSEPKRRHRQEDDQPPSQTAVEEDDAIIDVVSCASAGIQDQQHSGIASLKEEMMSDHSDAGCESDDQTLAQQQLQQQEQEQQRQREEELVAIQTKVEESKRNLGHLEGSLTERNARIVQMEMQREQINVCLHREWLIVKDLVSMVTAHKTQIEQHSLQLSQLRNPSTKLVPPTLPAVKAAAPADSRGPRTTSSHSGSRHRTKS